MTKLAFEKSDVTRVAVDLAKHVFQIHAVDANGKAVDKRQVKRAKVLDYFEALPPCTVGMEACGSSHHWAREIEKLGHTVLLIPPIYVKPFVKRHKNDAADAAAICEAMCRPDIRWVPIRTVENQADLMTHRVRETLISQRTEVLNAIRGHLAEIGVITAQGPQHARKLAALIENEDPNLPAGVISALKPLVVRLRQLEEIIVEIDDRIKSEALRNNDCRLLMSIPGVGPVKASALVATVGEKGILQFSGAKNFAAWLGLVPSQNGTGGKVRLGKISKMGDRYLRKLFVVGAHSVLYHCEKHNDAMRRWATKLKQTKKIKVAAVALANKTARIAYAVLATQKPYTAQ
jgi:transposase